MAKAKLSIEDTIFFYFSSATLPEVQAAYKRVQGIMAHRRPLAGRRKASKGFVHNTAQSVSPHRVEHEVPVAV